MTRLLKSPKRIITSVNAPLSRIALSGVSRVECSLANVFGRKPSWPATRMRRAVVYKPPVFRSARFDQKNWDIPLSDPKQERATTSARRRPPTGPKIAFPKSKATVFEWATNSRGRTM